MRKAKKAFGMKKKGKWDAASNSPRSRGALAHLRRVLAKVLIAGAIIVSKDNIPHPALSGGQTQTFQSASIALAFPLTLAVAIFHLHSLRG